MYRRPPTAEEMAAWGCDADDFASDPVDIWPENLPAFNLLAGLGTQWHMGNDSNGKSQPTGIRYSVAYHRMDRMGLTPEQYNELDADLQVMERAALEQMREDRQ